VLPNQTSWVICEEGANGRGGTKKEDSGDIRKGLARGKRVAKLKVLKKKNQIHTDVHKGRRNTKTKKERPRQWEFI